jgi:hypothetical protein
MKTHDTEGRVVTVTVTLIEDRDITDAKAVVDVRGQEFGGWGRARRDPDDPSIPAVGEELAIARALNQLSAHLLEGAAAVIEQHEGVPPDLHR